MSNASVEVYKMKKYDSIMKRVRRVEEKYGINYAKVGGKLFSGVTVVAAIAWIYMFLMNLMFILSMSLALSIGQADFSFIGNAFITVCVGSVLMVLGAVLFFVKFKITGSAICFSGIPFMVLSFANHLEDSLGFLGYKLSFYWRHSVPALVLCLMLIWLIAIAARERVKTEKQYKKIVENLYNTYHTGDDELTEEQWEEFLANYRV